MRERARWSASPATEAGSTLRATWLSRLVSVARYRAPPAFAGKSDHVVGAETRAGGSAPAAPSRRREFPLTHEPAISLAACHKSAAWRSKVGVAARMRMALAPNAPTG